MTAPLIVRSAEDMRADRQEVVLVLHDFSFQTPDELPRGTDQVQRQSERDAEGRRGKSHEHGLGEHGRHEHGVRHGRWT